jgi:nucleoside-diphosphate-sugar epimerase
MSELYLEHGFPQARKPARVVVLGGGGFIAGAILRRLTSDGIPALALGRPGLDLLAPGAADRLAADLREDDTLVFASAKAPCRNLAMLLENLVMAEAVCDAVQKRPVSHLVYLSSDAVYRDSANPLTEGSCAEPGSIHGVMHLAREVALRQVHRGPLALLRPTLAYGIDDPHNGYGPNRFRRLAAAGREIVLFGEGEERRDHVDVEDVAELARLMIVHRSAGIANAVSGTVVSFRELAEHASAAFEPRVAVSGSPRSGPMPHDGYRPFDNSAVLKAFPGFRFKSWQDGLSAIYARQATEAKS